jgi:hypothetical protein
MAKIETYSTATPLGDDLLLGSDDSATNATKNFTVDSLLTFVNAGSVPASASATGTKGMMAVASGYLYVCVDTNQWERVVIATW